MFESHIRTKRKEKEHNETKKSLNAEIKTEANNILVCVLVRHKNLSTENIK